jgi:hypothetical protein
VPESGAAEVKSAFEKVLRARKTNPAALEVADLYFFETVVRIHRAGEGAPYWKGWTVDMGHSRPFYVLFILSALGGDLNRSTQHWGPAGNK